MDVDEEKSIFAPYNFTDLLPNTFDQEQLLRKQRNQALAQANQQLSNYKLNGQQERVKIVQELTKRIGLDGLALCASKEDFSFVDELNIDMSVPWFEQIRGRELL